MRKRYTTPQWRRATAKRRRSDRTTGTVGRGEEGDSRDEHVSGYRLNDRVTSTFYMTPIKDEIFMFFNPFHLEPT